MIVKPFLALFKWAAALGLLAGLCGVAYLVHHVMQAERATEEEEKVASPSRVHNGVVVLGTESSSRYGLEERPARSMRWRERVQVYGEVVPNPRATVDIRAPFSGVLRAAAADAWPIPGRRAEAGKVFGWLDVRIGPQERLTLRDNLNSARLKMEGAENVVKIQQGRVNRLKQVTRSDLIPRQQLDDAEVLLAEAKTQLATAKAAFDLWRKAAEEISPAHGAKSSLYSYPLTAPFVGDVTDLEARPGANIEAGGLVARVVDFQRPLVRLDLPAEVLRAGPPVHAPLVAIPTHEPALCGTLTPGDATGSLPPLTARRVGPAPRVDAASQLVGYWYEVNGTPQGSQKPAAPGPAWRPGLRVKAFLPSSSAPERQAVAVPAGAVLFHEGLPWVYVAIEPGKYVRRQVRLLGRTGDDWVLAPRQGTAPVGIAPGEMVVTRQAQVLLSEELRPATYAPPAHGDRPKVKDHDDD